MRPPLNTLTPDRESDITSYGRHNRLIVLGDIARDRVVSVTVREDVDGLPYATEADVRRVANGWQRQHPRGARLRLVSRVSYWHPSGETIEWSFAQD